MAKVDMLGRGDIFNSEKIKSCKETGLHYSN